MRRGVANMFVDQDDLNKHFPKIIYSDGLKNLTADEIETVAMLMEHEYQRGLEEGKQPPKKTITDIYVEAATETEVKKLLTQLFDDTKKGLQENG
jgi:hypothetical protein